MATSVACADGAPSILEPRSDAARRVEGLWWLMFWISAVVVAVVIGFIAVAVRRRRAERGPVDHRAVRWGEPFIAVAGLGVSGVILAGTFVVSLRVLDALSDPPERPDLSIEVVGRNWWWEVRYPGFVTANEITIPAGETVELRLSTVDVIHSFWVPQLQVKKDHVPGVDNTMWLVADQPGRYRGQCAEYCGLQHAHMEFDVVALPAAEFDRWLAGQADPAPAPAAPEAVRGRANFLSSSCAGCHRVRGTTADGELGPDLTHLASRETIGAGLMPLTPENLADFVSNPQDDKLGVTMPPTEITGVQLDELVAYLLELE
ncbi:MAG: cytochrome c oxidase subunit II [Actinomycetota bacterium]